MNMVVLKEKNMPAVVDPAKCKASKDCLDVCPTGAIEMRDDKAVVLPDLCADCGVCIETCPNQAIKMED
jgi:NAD-dependent dihydropyrimidine dehydrogenase PreA subunit